ncbi:MAG: RagB/SusD family nutrient uptake outer membrane protein [Porphyromonas sp.]|nr:RagB/SusD family nutrient uptake outer membrane protein [Porphyromonas sp.]
MKLNKSQLLGAMLLATLVGASSCADKLNLEPLDNYGSTTFWRNEAHVVGAMNGIYVKVRSLAWTHSFTLGELRGGTLEQGAGVDGSSLFGGDIISHNLRRDNTGISNFGGYYDPIQEVNLLIDRLEKFTMTEAVKKNFLGQAYGLRAFLYFDLYRTYGGVPLRLTPDVVNGERDANKLMGERATPSAVMAQIKADIAKSLEYFGSEKTFDAYGVGGQKSAWSKAATETLKGEVYLWNAKVTIGDQTATNADLAEAKMALESVLANYNLSLQTEYAKIFSSTNKGNSEVIFASRFLDGEAASSGYSQFLYRNDGSIKTLYKADGTTRFGDALAIQTTGVLRYQYKQALYNMYGSGDTRQTATFEPVYNQDKSLAVAIVKKNIGEVNAQGNRVYTGDIIHYRLADVILMLAEVANMENDQAGVKKYIDMIRKRAYTPAVFDANTSLAYTAGDFKANELAILKERTKEFVQEGKRWYDLLRMTTAKTGGTALVFTADGAIDGAPYVLNPSERYKVLWPVDKTTLNNDTKLKQTPGY